MFTGRSLQLNSAFIDALLDGGGGGAAKWCLTARVGGTEYSRDGDDVDYGTPGQDNLVCP